MNWSLFWIFVALNVANVIIQTVKSLVTIKCGKIAAALVNALAYGLYTIVVVYMVCELDLWLKTVVVAVANLVGVYIVKVWEEKARKDKLWKVEATVPISEMRDIEMALQSNNISYNCFNTSDKHKIFNIFCPTQKESAIAKKILDEHHAKYFVSESKIL